MTTQPCRNCGQRPAATPEGWCAACAPAAVPPPHQGAPQPQPQPQPQSPYAPPPPGGVPQPPQGYGTPPYPAPPHGGMPPYGAQPPHGFAQYQDPRGLATAATVLLGICIAVWTLALLAGGRMMNLISDLEEGRFVSLDTAEAADTFYGVSGLLQALALLATGIVFLMWFYRIRVNAEVFAPYGHRMKRGWAIGGWLVPIVSFWFPKKIANDVWKASAPQNEADRTGLLTGWWLVWVFSTVVGPLSVTSGGDLSRDEQLNEIRREISTTIVSDLLGLIAAVLAILVVRRLTRFQLDTYARGPVPQAYPAPSAP